MHINTHTYRYVCTSVSHVVVCPMQYAKFCGFHLASLLQYNNNNNNNTNKKKIVCKISQITNV